MRLDEATCRRLLGGARSLRMATVGADGAPHIVPIVFALSGDTVVSMVDAKPKSTPALRRLETIAHEPRVALLADHYDDDWSLLWWVRADAVAIVTDDPAAMAAARDLLTARYPQYRDDSPPGPLISLTITRLTGWSSSDVTRNT